MPADRLAMRQIKDILRLRHDAGLSLREIARSLNLSVGVVSKYLQLAAVAGIGWPPLTAGLSACNRRSAAMDSSAASFTNFGSATRSCVVQPGA